MEEKILLQISDVWGDKAFPLDWNKLPDEFIGAVESDYLYDCPSYSPVDGFGMKTVIYFRKVKKFRKGITEYPGKNNIIFGL